MGFHPVAKALVLSMLLTSFLVNVFAAEEDILTEHHHGRYGPTVSPSPSPSHHHHHKHHPPSHPPSIPPSHPPVKPPSHPPVKPPSHPPVKPPTKPPSHPPVKPPTKPPSHPPVKPPTKPPSYPPVKPPTKPPSHPPVKPPSHPPTKPPSHPPVKPPSQPPVKPPSYPPVKPPTPPPSPLPRKLVAVQGVVYCKSCKYKGYPTLLGASPLSGAVVQLECRNTRYPLRIKAKTDKNGYFLIQAPRIITTYGARKCKVSLISSPLRKCNKPTDFHGGISGSPLILEKISVSKPLPFLLYTVGPFAFEPANKCY